MARHISLVVSLLLATTAFQVTAFATTSRTRSCPQTVDPRNTRLFSYDKEAEEEEKARVEILKSRRQQIRATIRSAEKLRYYRIKNGDVPELDEDGNPVKSGGKEALAFTAFVVAAGAVALRVGGRAALVSAVGLDFLTDSPELKENLDSVLNAAETMDPATKLILFTLSWTAVKCFLFDAGGIVLALSSGILFGGVFQGALVSAAAATFGSSVAFGLAKMDTPFRKKALEVLDEYPSLRGIEKVVARDGLKAILTLRLAPILPIPLGMYNYIYGVTNVGLFDLCGGVFLGSIKPYLLDSYLGYFGKTLVDGTGDQSGTQDIILLVALGVSVLIGVFASQLASETWDSVLQEVEDEKKNKSGEEETDELAGVKTEFFGWKLPQWVVGFQISLQDADERVRATLASEFNAKVWNYTDAEEIPHDQDPSNFPDSAEVLNANKGFDIAASVCDGLVLTPILFEYYWKISDPLFDEDEDELLRPPSKVAEVALLKRLAVIKARANARIKALDEVVDDES